MSTWMKLLLLELDGIKESDIIEPDQELGKPDSFVGTMSDTSRRLFTLGRLLEKDARQYKLDADFCGGKAERLELGTKSDEFITKSNIVRELMWTGIRDDFGLWGRSIGVRTGFKVVTMPDDTDNIPPIIKKLFGGL